MQEDRTAAAPDEKLAQLEAALQEALAERNRLWHDAQRVHALEHDVQHVRRILEDMQQSPSWRLTAPLRRAKELVGGRARTYGELARKARARLRA